MPKVVTLLGSVLPAILIGLAISAYCVAWIDVCKVGVSEPQASNNSRAVGDPRHSTDSQYSGEQEGKLFKSKTLLFPALILLIGGYVLIDKGWSQQAFRHPSNTDFAFYVTLSGLLVFGVGVWTLCVAAWGNDVWK